MNTTALGAIVMMIPAWSTLSAQETLTGGPDERPAWAADGVPDPVWILVEASRGTEEEERKTLLEQAEGHARAAMEGHENDVERRFALTVVLGNRIEVESGGAKVRAATQFHQELETILQLDPQHTGAHHLLGRLYAGVRRSGRLTRWISRNLLDGGELKKATWPAAEEHLGFAERQAPEISDHHLQLAALYADTDRLGTALEELEHVFQLPVETLRERAVWDEALEVKADWERAFERGAVNAQGCRQVGPRRSGRRRTVCE